MTNQHSISPPPELVQQWNMEGRHQDYCTLTESIAARAAQWGADAELEACCEWMRNASFGLSVNTSSYQLRAARRPKPPSLKEQAFLALSHLVKGANESMDTTEAAEYIRRALEALSDD